MPTAGQQHFARRQTGGPGVAAGPRGPRTAPAHVTLRGTAPARVTNARVTQASSPHAPAR